MKKSVRERVWARAPGAAYLALSIEGLLISKQARHAREMCAKRYKEAKAPSAHKRVRTEVESARAPTLRITTACFT